MNVSARNLARLLFALLWSAAAVSLSAHEPGLSVAELRVTADQLDLKVSYAVADVRRWLPPYSLPARSGESPVAGRAALEVLRPLVPDIWELRATEGPITPVSADVEWLAGDNVAFVYRYRLPAPTSVLTARACKLAALPATHRELVRVFGVNDTLHFETTLTAAQSFTHIPLARTPAAGDAATAPAARGFFLLGLEHIWTGYDHLLFLLALLVASRGFRSVVVIISCFTFAHSLTLGAATLGWVWLPSALVEPLIAASIVFVGVENLLRRGEEPKHRGWLMFGFGLIHGFGFASVLRDLGVGNGAHGLAGPLVLFNLGVEAGQICVVALVLPITAWIFRSETTRLRGAVVLSALVSVAGLYWLAQRTLFG